VSARIQVVVEVEANAEGAVLAALGEQFAAQALAIGLPWFKARLWDEAQDRAPELDVAVRVGKIHH